MAELALVRVSLKLVWGLVANRVINSLEHGDFADEKLRQLLLSEFRKIHESLNALRRKELVASIAFMENGYELLKEDLVEAKKEFNKARDAAQVAFGVVQDAPEKVLATKVMVASVLHEFEDKPETAASLCMKYIMRLNSLPEVQKACGILLGQKFGGKLRALSSSSTREELIGTVSEINRCVWQFVYERARSVLEKGWPRIECGSEKLNPLGEFILLRRCATITNLPEHFGSVVAMVIADNKLFFTVAPETGTKDDPLVANAIKFLDLETREFGDLVGHTGFVVSILSLDGKHVASGSMDKQVIIWDANSLKCLHILTGHEGSVRALAMNDTHLFTASTDCTIKIWNKDTFELIHTLEGHTFPISSLCVSNRHLFSYGVGEGILYWDLKKRESVHNIKIFGAINNMHIVRNFLVVHCGNELRIVNLGNLQECGKLPNAGTMSLALSNSICCSSESVLKMMSLPLMKCIGNKDLSTDQRPLNIKSVTYDPPTGYLYLAGTENSTRKQDVILRL